MKTENYKLKRQLIIQSFMPLFFLILIKYFDCSVIHSIILFSHKLVNKDFLVLLRVLIHPAFGSFIVMSVSIIGIISGVFAMWQFKDAQMSGFIDAGDKVKIDEEKTESGISFFMTFVLPLLLDDVTSAQGFLIFIGILGLTMRLMWKTNLYYQNPILTILGYKVFEFHFVDSKRDKEKAYIAVCHSEIDQSKIVKWKYIADNVVLMYNKNQ